MAYGPTPGHSGSRWEPAPVPPATSSAGDRELPAEAPAPSSDRRERRRRRRPVVAFLVTVLTLGTASAGIAWFRAPDDTVIDPSSRASGAPFRGAHSGGDRGPRPDGDGPRSFPDRPEGGRAGDHASDPQGDQGEQEPNGTGSTT